MKIRIKFAKEGAMKYIGHLDIMRYFQKAMRRADVDIKYSEGFSPHQVMSFASPLGVGLTSRGEYMDIEVNSTKSSKEMVDRLNAVMVEGMEILSYRRLGEGAGNAMSIVAAADYLIWLSEECRPADVEERCQALLGREEILVEKKTKKGLTEVNIRPMILELHGAKEGVFMRLCSGSAANLKPELVLEALGLKLPYGQFQINRQEVYADQDGVLIPLEELGEEIE